MKAIAIDDEPLALEVIELFISKVPFIDLRASFTDVSIAVEILTKETIDLLFLDIKMPDISGIEFYADLSIKPMVIFTTAYTEHAFESFELDPIDYLLKPFSLEKFEKSCKKALELYTYRNTPIETDYMYIKTGYEQIKVMYEDILYVEGSNNYVTYYLKTKKILSRNTIREVAQTLPSNKFVRIHRSYIISINKVDKIERFSLVINKVKIPIGETYNQAISAIINK